MEGWGGEINAGPTIEAATTNSRSRNDILNELED